MDKYEFKNYLLQRAMDWTLIKDTKKMVLYDELHEDGHIEIIRYDQNMINVRITEKGISFLHDGGYKAQHRKKVLKKFLSVLTEAIKTFK